MKRKNFIVSILIIVACFLNAAKTNAQNVDINLLANINPQKPNSIVMRGLSSSVYPLSIASPVSMLAIGYLEKDKRLQQYGWQAVGSLAINTVLTEALKYAVNRNRPYIKYPAEVHPYSIESDPSFPSGHTSTAFATATTLSLECKRWYVFVPAYLWAAGVGYSRLYLGEHYPTDVLAGAVVGAGSALLSHWLTNKVFSKTRRSEK